VFAGTNAFAVGGFEDARALALIASTSANASVSLSFSQFGA
jgi:hypothetical protein